ncbi:MAG: type IV pilus twitching motility protein PilT [Armatimonadetes bacterium]|nr:type IV pilus twitching motility protein PilT [Armatimonadota bacterium]
MDNSSPYSPSPLPQDLVTPTGEPPKPEGEAPLPPVGGPPGANGAQQPTVEAGGMAKVGSGQPKTLEDLHIDELLHVVVDRNCSDLHISANSEPVIREDGQLKRLNYEKFTPQQCQRMLYEIVSDDQITRFETTLELDFSYQLPRRARFRVNLYRDRGAVAAAFRLISNRIPTCRELNLPPLLEQLTEKPRGLILVTGPTGSGKSTSLAAMINYININKSHHIITIEDPIEYLHTHKLSVINQRELGSDTKSFANALRACLREDPDVLLVGEMRDTETIALAITAAETGHLVFATLHTNNAAESIDRIIDVFPPGQQEQIRVQLSNNIVAIVAQQLLPRASGPGRVPVNEIMIASPAIRNLIREGKTHQIPSMIQTSAAMGMLSMDQCLRDMYMKGVITMEEALTRCQNVEELKKMINLGGAQGGPPSSVRK